MRGEDRCGEMAGRHLFVMEVGCRKNVGLEKRIPGLIKRLRRGLREAYAS